MTVTKIEEINRSRVRIFIDSEFAFVLYKGELRIYNIRENEEIREADYTEIMRNILPKRAKLRSMNLLKSRTYTEKQLRDKLHHGEYPQNIVNEAVDYVKSYGYIDDRKYAEDYIIYNMENKSRKRMEQDLYIKGIDKKIMQEVMEEILKDGNAMNEMVMAQRLLRKKNYDPNTAETKEKQKLSAFLYRKGFTAETIRSVLLLDITSN